MNYVVELENPVRCPRCGELADLYVDAETMIGTYRCVMSHQPTRKVNKKEKILAMKAIANDIDNDQLKALANLMVSIVEDRR